MDRGHISSPFFFFFFWSVLYLQIVKDSHARACLQELPGHFWASENLLHVRAS